MTQNALDYAERHENANNGIRMLFYGFSGTGKTELARYMSQKLGKDILLKRASDILGMYVGESEKNIKQAFEEAERTNSILLFDEADSFFADRNNAQHSWERRIRFMNQDKVNSSVITKELIDLQKEKKNGSFCQKMGF